MKKNVIIIALVILVIIVGITVAFVIKSMNDIKEVTATIENDIEEQENNEEPMQEENQEENETEGQEEVEQNETTENDTANQNTENNQEQVTGKEEQESSQEEQKQAQNDDEIALELAKDEWGLDENSYKFIIENKDGYTYHISVRDLSGNAICWYTVDIATGAVQ